MRIILLAAERGAGKTTACLRLLDLARGAGLTVGGIVAPARFDAAGAKVGIDVVDVAGGEHRNLAVIEPDPIRATVGQYRFDPGTEAWALDVLLAALEQPLDLLIIDEIGPLELLQGRGYATALGRLPSARCHNVIILVRAPLAEALSRRLHALTPLTVPLTPANRDGVPTVLLKITGGSRQERSLGRRPQ